MKKSIQNSSLNNIINKTLVVAIIIMSSFATTFAKEVRTVNGKINIQFYGKSDQGNIIYNYNLQDWPEEAKSAIVETIHILNNTFEINNTMTFSVIWSEDLTNIAEAYVKFAEVKASSNFWNLDSNFKYPRELLNQLSSNKTYSGENIVIAFNSKKDWCFSSTQEPSATQQDLITVALHELSHGLGLSSSFTKNNETKPYIYDKYLVDNIENYNYIVDTNYYPTKADQTAALTSNSLYYAGPNVLKDNDYTPIKLHAPEKLTSASVVHVDRQYHDDHDGELLIAGTSYGKSTRFFGNYIVNMLKDMGWETRSSYNSALSNDNIAMEDISNMINVSAANGTINIENNSFENIQVAIYSISGKLVKNETISGNGYYQVNSNEVYIVKVNNKTYKIKA